MWQMLAAIVFARVVVLRIVRHLVARWTVKKTTPTVPAINKEEIALLQQRWDAKLKELGATGKQYLVVGTGFLGSRVISALLQRGESNVRAFDLVITDAIKAQLPGVQWLQGDVNDMAAVQQACRGVEVVYSTFANIRYFETLPYQLATSMKVNVDGTNTLIEACISENVKMLISTSTSNVCVTKDLSKLQEFDETTSYVNNTNAPHHYAYSKALAEQLVLQANGKPLAAGGQLTTACIRPCSGIFGAKDRFLLQRLVQQGYYEIVVVSTIDWVYVDNVAYGHLLMEKALTTTPKLASGQAVCVSNNEAMSIMDLINIAREFRPDLTIKHLPRWLMFGLADLLDAARRLLKHNMPAMGELQMLSRASFVAAELSYVLKSDKATRLLGYRPVFTVREAVQLSLAALAKS